ncbi:RNA polymerase sigma factor [Clostridia bacterium]|nr:RNA polymerase sigma factor [Clostridia bacterium]
MKQDVMTLITQAQKGDKKARDYLVQENLPLVWSIVRRFSNRGKDPEDLFQVGCIGLIKSIDKFDTGYEVRFSTYAVPLITGEIKRHLRDDGPIKVSRHLKEQAAKIELARQAFCGKEKREPSLNELSAETGILREDIVMALDAASRIESIYKTVSNQDGKEVSLADKLANEKEEQENLENHLLLQSLLEELSGEERHFIKERYFEEKTQSKLAQELGISQVQVSRLEKKILLKMRKKV